MDQILKYTGKGLEEPVRFGGEDLDVYIPSDKLIVAVNLALYLKKRPLLLMGEPGTGKTRLAEAVAYELHGEKMYAHFFKWNIKSTTKAKDGLYQYDALSRLYDANLHIEKNRMRDVNNIYDYISIGPLGKAFTTPPNGHLPNILLIDEIDKGSIDFPNDLLSEIERQEFEITELSEDNTLKAESDVLIFITSNREKELPMAFLRRCLYHYINFPGETRLKEIVARHFYRPEKDELVIQAVELFMKIRDEIPENDKKPSTSELLDWFSAIEHYQQLLNKADNERTDLENLFVVQVDKLNQSFNMNREIPFKQLLLKTFNSSEYFK